jgi:Ser/Thr protein kinase RdoA (MazF antagonist)
MIPDANNHHFFPVAKSFLSQVGLAETIAAAYDLSDVRCQLIAAFMRDVYRVSSGEQRYVFFIYRHRQRTLDEIEAEWRFVDYLASKGIAVAPAIVTNQGEYVLEFSAPEGIRYGVLTTFVEGQHLRQRSSVEAVKTYGRLIAQIHLLADEMPFSLARPANDIKQIVNRSIAAFAAEVPDHPEDLAYLQRCAAIILSRLEALPQEKPYYGLIHGDVIRANAQVADDGIVTILDFDLCGPGWRAYDIASYLAVIRGLAEESIWEGAFLDGYEQIRPIPAIEREALPVFEVARHIFSIGVPAINVDHWGSAYLHAFLDQSLAQVREGMKVI